MFKSQKHIFWQAFIVTISIFVIGLFFGMVLESWRVNKVDDFYQNSEINLLDVKLQGDIYSQSYFDCEDAINENIKFADRIFEESKILDRYESSNQLTEKDLFFQHKKYDLLRVSLLLNSLEIKEKCNSSYSNVVYFYNYRNPSLKEQAKQNTFSKILVELKKIKGDSIILIPIAANNNITSVDLLLSRYNVSKENLPVILIDDKRKIYELENIDQILRYF